MDAGCDDGAGFEMSLFKKPIAVLKEYGLSPNDITDVIITHSHHDHIEAVKYYENVVYTHPKKRICRGKTVYSRKLYCSFDQ